MGKKGILGDIEITPKEMQDALHANADGGDPNYIGLNDDTLNLGEAKSFVDDETKAKLEEVAKKAEEVAKDLANTTADVAKAGFEGLKAGVDAAIKAYKENRNK